MKRKEKEVDHVGLGKVIRPSVKKYIFSCGLRVKSGPKYRGIGVVKCVKLVSISVSVSVRENLNYLNGVVIYIYVYIFIYIIINW